MLFITRILSILFLLLGFNHIAVAENYVCSHIFNGINKINKYEKIDSSLYVQFASKGLKHFHKILFENEKELHLYRRVVKFGSCTTTGSAITVINKQTLKSTGSALCVPIPSTVIHGKCVKF